MTVVVIADKKIYSKYVMVFAYDLIPFLLCTFHAECQNDNNDTNLN